MRRGVVQGDIFSPLCFIIALTVLLTRHGECAEGSAIDLFELFIKNLEFADDAALVDLTLSAAAERLNRFTAGAIEDADMEVSVPKIECMHIDSELVQHFSRVTVGEEDYDDETLVEKWSHPCSYCNAVYGTQHGLNIHLARWCGEATRECYTEEFPVDRILQARGPLEHRYYQVLWAGYTKAECEELPWEPARHLLDCAALDEYWATAQAQITDHLPEQAGEHRCKWCCKFYKTHAALKGQ